MGIQNLAITTKYDPSKSLNCLNKNKNMSQLEQSSNNSVYLSIVQGSLRQTVSEGTPNAVRREWEAGGRKGVKHELIYKNAVGRITDVSFYEGESEGRKFTTLNIRLDEQADGKTPVITTGVESRYAQEFLKKLPNIDLEEDVKILPYSFIPDGEEKEKTGVSILQRDHTGQFTKKVKNFFWDEKTNGAAHGFPVPDKSNGFDSDDWKVYFTQVKKFLISYTRENILPKFGDTEQSAVDKAFEEELNPESIPF